MRPRVLLLSMPWTMFLEPSLGLGILKAALEDAGIPNRVAHLNLLLLQYLRPESYEALSANYGLNDFRFTNVLQGVAVTPDQREALRAMLAETYGQVDLRARGEVDLARYVDFAFTCRDEIVPKFLADCLKVVDASDATLVGFTCMFDQTIASLALAKLIKAKHPDKLIVLGGYAVELPVGPMLLRAFPFVDAVCHGEGEEKIAALARASVDRARLADVRGLSFRTPAGDIRRTAPAAPIDLDMSPIPDYRDWFDDVARLAADHAVAIKTCDLPLESSRGCWWGQVSHCTFCGIDDETMRYRFKSPARTRQTLATLRDRHGISSFRFSDYILPRAYYATLLPELAKEEPPYVLHWEMKANVRSEDVRIMRRAGIDRVQPGIESFSTPVLRKMAKGVTGIQNVLTLWLLMEQEVTIFYNILYAFPGDDLEDYRDLCRRIPLLYHLTPPTTYVPVLTTRYAPMHTDPSRFGITPPLRADGRYHMIFSDDFRAETGFSLDQYCYVFERRYPIPPRSSGSSTCSCTSSTTGARSTWRACRRSRSRPARRGSAFATPATPRNPSSPRSAPTTRRCMRRSSGRSCSRSAFRNGRASIRAASPLRSRTSRRRG